MASIARTASGKVHGLLTAETGLPYTVGALAAEQQMELAPIEAAQVLAQWVAPDTAEKTAGVRYPAVYVYCEGVVNQLKEKFRTFSGKAEMVVETRATHDRLEGVSRELEVYASAVTSVLDACRGDWEDGMFYTGGYKVEFGPIKRGGRNFVQAARVSFEVCVSL